MPPIVEFEVFRDYLGIAAGSADEDDASRLLDAICARVRRLARRDLEGDEGGSYDQVIRIRGAEEFTLPHAPVRAITSISRVWFDGTEDDRYLAGDWRLDDAARGLVRLRPGSADYSRFHNAWADRAAVRGVHLAPDYVRVVWTTTGEMPPELPQAVLEWGRARWDARDDNPALAAYQTGTDSETYAATLAGRPPREVLLAILGARHARGGAVV